jgi:iron complex outermembrane receptor protein
VPMSITAITNQTLQQTSITTGTDLIKLVPTLNVQQEATQPDPIYSLRGIRDGVVAYFNEVPVAAVDDQLFDLSSVQALAGPQGTLFGRNSTGGALLFLPQRPTDHFGGYVEAGYGNYNWRQLTAILNIPVNDKLQIRLDGRLVARDPVVKNLIGPGEQSLNRDVGRVSILFSPTPNVSNYTVLAYSHRDESPVAIISSNVVPTAGCFQLAPPPAPPTCLYGSLPSQYGALQNKLGIRTISDSTPAYLKADQYDLSNIFTAKLPAGLTFKYIFGYEYKTFNEFSSKATINLPFQIGLDQVRPETTLTNEVQLQGKAFNNRLNWTVGGFNEINYVNFFLSFALFAPQNVGFNLNSDTNNASISKLTSNAVYGQGTFAITDKLNFTAGIRYTSESPSLQASYITPEFTFFGPQVCGLPNQLSSPLADCVRHLKSSYSAITYNISLDYHLSHNMLLYVTTRRGFNGGGFNSNATNDPGSPQSAYGPETITDYEVGVNSEGRVGRVPFRVNLSGYYAGYTNIQRTVQGVDSNDVPFLGIINGPSATIYGIQLESTWRLTPHLTVSANYGFLHTQYNSSVEGFSAGNQFAQAPEHTVNLIATYTHPVPAGGNVVATVDYSYQSRISFEDANFGDGPAFQNPYGIADIRLSWNSVLGSRVDASVFVKNLTDVAYAVERQDITSSFGFVGTVYNDPRTFGFELRYNFGQ